MGTSALLPSLTMTARDVRAARPSGSACAWNTCHLFAAGYDIRTASGYRRAMAECEATLGRRRVIAFHLNDAKAPLGCRRKIPLSIYSPA